MTFPVVQARATTGSTGLSGTTFTVNLPTGITAGDLLAVFLGDGKGTAVTWTAGGTWSSLAKDNNSTNTGLQAFYKIATGSEGATDTFTISTSAGVPTAVAIRVSATDGTLQKATAATGSGTTPNPPAETPSGGAADYLWIAAFANAKGVASAAPASYSNLTTQANGTTSGIGTAERSLNASTEDPGTFTTSSGAWVAQTFVVSPATAVVNTLNLAVSCVSSVARNSTIGKALALSCVSAVSKALSVGKALAVSCASAIAVTAIKVRVVSLAVNCTTSVTKSLSASKALAVSCVSAVSAVKQIAKPLTASCVSAVSAVKQIAKPLTAACASAVSSSRSALKQLSVSSATSVAKQLRAGKALAVSCTSTVVRGALSITHSLAVSCTSATTKQLRAGKALAVSCTSAVTKQLGVAKALAVTCTSATARGAFHVTRSLAVSCTSAVTPFKQVARHLAVISSTAVSVRKSVAITLAEAVVSTVSALVEKFVTANNRRRVIVNFIRKA